MHCCRALTLALAGLCCYQMALSTNYVRELLSDVCNAIHCPTSLLLLVFLKFILLDQSHYSPPVFCSVFS